jgi:hypothetical protein
VARLRLRARGYERVEVKAGPVTLEGLKLVYSDERVEEGDPWDIVVGTVEALAKRFYFVEVEAEVLERGRAPGESELPDRIYKGEYGAGASGRKGLKHMTHRPARLERVGVLYFDALEKRDRGGYFVLNPEEDIEWHRVDGEVYVHEGQVSVEAGERVPVYLVLDTDSGRRWLRLLPSGAPLRAPR